MTFLNILTLIFFVLVLLSLHTYVLYPVIIKLISFTKSFKSYPGNYYPSISIVLSAYNEEKTIEERIKNIALQAYDFSKIEVLVGSDCSTDSTNQTLSRLAKEYNWLRVFIFNERSGKAGVINNIVKSAKNEILIFTDANTVFGRDAIKNLVEDFRDKEVGGVSGRLILTETQFEKRLSVEEKRYWEYETFIKKAEGRLGILVGANGGIFAIRRNLFAEIPTQKAVTDDLFLSLEVLRRKFKFTYNPKALAYEEVGKSVGIEFKRKIRFASTNYQTLQFFKNILFGKNILLSFAFFSHKIIRWFFPHIMILLLLLNFLLLSYGTLFLNLFILQIALYVIALIGFIFSFLRIRISIFSLLFFFVMANIALIIGWIRFLRKKHSVIWSPTER